MHFCMLLRPSCHRSLKAGRSVVDAGLAEALKSLEAFGSRAKKVHQASWTLHIAGLAAT